MVDSNGVELDLTNPFIARKLERIRAEKLVDHTFMRKLLSKKISVMEVGFPHICCCDFINALFIFSNRLRIYSKELKVY